MRILGHARAIALAFVLAIVPVTVQARSAAPTLVIENVTVIPMTEGGEILPGRTVVIAGNRIVAIDDQAPAGHAAEVRRVDGSGKWLIPGLSDMHVHIGNERLLRLLTGASSPADGSASMQDYFTPFIAHGVLQVFDLAAMPETVGQRIEIESGRVLGPHIATAAMIDGAEPVLPFGVTKVATTPEEGRQAVRDIAADGHRFVKVYSRLDLPTFDAVLAEASARGLRVLGHIPQRGKGITASFFQPGFELVVHAEEFAQQTAMPDPDAIPSYVDMARKNGTALIATLTANERIFEIASDPQSLTTRRDFAVLPAPFRALSVDFNPYAARAGEGFAGYARSIVEFNAPFVRAYDAAGLTILTGSDAGVPGVVAGFALHDELEALAAAGLETRTVLEGSTRLAAEWLGVDEDRGTVAVGKRADLVLLDANPLDDITNTRRIAAVIRDGRYLDREELDAMMRDLVARNAD